MQIKLDIPRQVISVADTLLKNSFSAYITGECIRDLLMGERVVDYDIVTNADLYDAINIFREKFSVDSSNIENGDIIVRTPGIAVQVSCYKGNIDSLGFFERGETLFDDLARRDFSIDAMAYSIDNRLIDPFDGYGCIQIQGLIKPVTTSPERPEKIIKNCFSRTPSSILKALSYAASGNYIIPEETKTQIMKNAQTVTTLRPEIQNKYLTQILMGKKAGNILLEYTQIFSCIIPEITPTIDFDCENSAYGCTLWEHICKSISYATPHKEIRYALLFHALGKPDCRAEIDGRIEYHGHAERGKLLADGIMKRLNFDIREREEICFLVKNHDVISNGKRSDIKRKINIYSPDTARLLLKMKYADLRGMGTEYADEIAAEQKKAVDELNDILSKHECYCPGMLAVNVRDLLSSGCVKNISQAERLIERLFELVLERPLLNNKAELMSIAAKAVHNKKER